MMKSDKEKLLELIQTLKYCIDKDKYPMISMINVELHCKLNNYIKKQGNKDVK